MGVLLFILMIIGAIIALALIIALFLPSKVIVERSMNIQAPASIIFENVNNLRNWEAWSTWAKKDPNMISEYEGPEAGVGATHKWKGEPKTVGEGTLKIVESEENKSIKTAIDFGRQGSGSGYWKFDEKEGVTTVLWGMSTDMGKNLIGRWFGLMFDKMIGKDFEEGLSNIKKVVEG